MTDDLGESSVNCLLMDVLSFISDFVSDNQFAFLTSSELIHIAKNTHSFRHK